MEGLLPSAASNDNRTGEGFDGQRKSLSPEEGKTPDSLVNGIATKAIEGNRQEVGRPTNLSPTGVEEIEKPKKTVTFNKFVGVMLIPKNEEYKDVGIHEEMHYSEDSLKGFKKDTMNELRDYMTDNGVDIKAAMTCLYQPKANESQENKDLS